MKNNSAIRARSPPQACALMSPCTRIQQQLINRKVFKMRLLYINNDGAGFADHINVSDGITVEQFFSQQMAGRKPEDYLIRVNRQPVARDYVLKENDRVTITPLKIEGATV